MNKYTWKRTTEKYPGGKNLDLGGLFCWGLNCNSYNNPNSATLSKTYKLNIVKPI